MLFLFIVQISEISSRVTHQFKARRHVVGVEDVKERVQVRELQSAGVGQVHIYQV